MIFKKSNCFCYRLIVDYKSLRLKRKYVQRLSVFTFLNEFVFKVPIWSFTEFLYRDGKKNLRTIWKGHRYLRNSTIRRYLCTTSLKKRIIQLSKNFDKIVYNINLIYLTKSSQRYQTTRSLTPLIVIHLEMLY